MRLRNRILKATAYNDPTLCRWERDKREFYRSLWACADDSACIEDDMFGVKLAAWPSPLDDDMTVARFEAWRDELIEAGKAVPYMADGKRYLYLPQMAEHEHPRNPQEPDYPLPPWVSLEVAGEGRARRVSYVHRDCTETVETPNDDSTRSPVLSCSVLSGPALTSPDQTPVPTTSTGLQRGGARREVHRDNATPAIVYWEGKLERPLNTDELESVRRWVRNYGITATRTGLGYAFQDGFAADLSRVHGQIKALRSSAVAS